MILGNETYGFLTGEERQIITDANAYFSRLVTARRNEHCEHNERRQKVCVAKLTLLGGVAVACFTSAISWWGMLFLGAGIVGLMVGIYRRHERYLRLTSVADVERELAEELGYERISMDYGGSQGPSGVPGYTGAGYMGPSSGFDHTLPLRTRLSPGPTEGTLTTYETLCSPYSYGEGGCRG